MARSIRPARVSQARSRKPLRWLSRSGLRAPTGAPVRVSTSSAIRRSAAKASIARTRSASALFSIRSRRAILASVIVVSWFRFKLRNSNPSRRPAVTAPGVRYAREGFAHALSGSLLHHSPGLGHGFSLGAEHAYGPGCYRPGGCASIIEEVAERIDARAFNPSFPQPFPRYVQIAIWRLCAQNGLGLCNGLTIDDRTCCANVGCPLFQRCDRVPLRLGQSQGNAP